MNRIAISMTMLIPPLFLLSLALAQPVSAAPSNGGAPVEPPRGLAATAAPDGGFPRSGVVFGGCTGSACSAGGGPTRVPDPLRAAPLVVNVAPGVLGVNVASEPLQVNVASDAPRGNIAPGVFRVDIAPDALRVGIALDEPRVDSASDLRSVGRTPRPVSGAGATPLADDIARGGTGSASSLPRVFSDLLSRLLDLVQRAPLPLTR
ncbi:hypothetical protein ACQPXH_10430 [Nocardia sp. CA-135953]|uniref:hypothetical protein n=1 Tax=Nocardia sp. CA-135953 TaxID=3239978 RepID=UPI003D969E50